MCVRSFDVRVWLALCVLILPGCEKLKEMRDGKPAPAPATTASAPTPATTPQPAPTESAPPPVVTKTPKQLLEEFLALPAAEKKDEHLKQLAELKAGLDGIQSLDLRGSGVTDAGLPFLAAFPNLSALDLSDTKVSNAGMASLAGLKPLRELRLANTKAVDNEGIQALTALKDLESLSVIGLAISDEVLPLLAQFEGLQTLNISGNPDIYGRGFTELASKGAFKHLKELSCGGSKFGTYGLEEMQRLPQLEVLRAGGCDAVGVAVNGLTACSHLRILDLSSNSMVDANIKNINRMKNLEELYLDHMPLTDVIFESIKSMKKLKVLSIRGTHIRQQSVMVLKQKFLKNTEIRAVEGTF